MQKTRIDLLLVNRGFYESRERAQAAIMAGNVFVNNEIADKAGTTYDDLCEILIKGKTNPFVSRGGLKLQKALDYFEIKLSGKIAMDVGASTGGFTDCMLQNGAIKVYALDVGYGQLAWSLRSDDRVVCLERTNIRHLEADKVSELLDFATIDVSFISLSKVLPKVVSFMKQGSQLICLIKPQFEAGRDKVGKKGVVREISTHEEVIRNVINAAYREGLSFLGLSFSPIKGPEGNIEFLCWFEKKSEKNEISASYDDIIKKVVESAHIEL
ncbi:MAG: TlyA family RNA methyltransferase [Bacillota bacterium]